MNCANHNNEVPVNNTKHRQANKKNYTDQKTLKYF